MLEMVERDGRENGKFLLDWIVRVCTHKRVSVCLGECVACVCDHVCVVSACGIFAFMHVFVCVCSPGGVLVCVVYSVPSYS